MKVWRGGEEMKISSRHTVEIKVPLPLGVNARLTDRTLHLTAESGSSVDHATMQILLLASKIQSAAQDSDS